MLVDSVTLAVVNTGVTATIALALVKYGFVPSITFEVVNSGLTACNTRTLVKYWFVQKLYPELKILLMIPGFWNKVSTLWWIRIGRNCLYLGLGYRFWGYECS